MRSLPVSRLTNEQKKRKLLGASGHRFVGHHSPPGDTRNWAREISEVYPMYQYNSTNNTILLETEIIHRLVNRFLNLLPIRSMLDELVYVLCSLLAKVTTTTNRQKYLGLVCTPVSGNIPNDLRQILSILNNIHMPQHLQMRKIRNNRRNLERRYKCMIRIQVSDDLKSSVQRYDLPLDVFLQDPVQTDV